MNSAASGVSCVPPSATLAGLDGSTAMTIFESLMVEPPQSPGGTLPTSTPAGVSTVASTRHTRGPSPSTQTASPEGDAASARRVTGADAPAPGGRTTGVKVSAPSARHRSSTCPLSGRSSAAHSRPSWLPAGGVQMASVHGSAAPPLPVGTPVAAIHVICGPEPLGRSNSPLVVAAANPVPPRWRDSR